MLLAAYFKKSGSKYRTMIEGRDYFISKDFDGNVNVVVPTTDKYSYTIRPSSDGSYFVGISNGVPPYVFSEKKEEYKKALKDIVASQGIDYGEETFSQRNPNQGFIEKFSYSPDDLAKEYNAYFYNMALEHPGSVDIPDFSPEELPENFTEKISPRAKGSYDRATGQFNAPKAQPLPPVSTVEPQGFDEEQPLYPELEGLTMEQKVRAIMDYDKKMEAYTQKRAAELEKANAAPSPAAPQAEVEITDDMDTRLWEQFMGKQAPVIPPPAAPPAVTAPSQGGSFNKRFGDVYDYYANQQPAAPANPPAPAAKPAPKVVTPAQVVPAQPAKPTTPVAPAPPAPPAPVVPNTPGKPAVPPATNTKTSLLPPMGRDANGNIVIQQAVPDVTRNLTPLPTYQQEQEALKYGRDNFMGNMPYRDADGNWVIPGQKPGVNKVVTPQQVVPATPNTPTAPATQAEQTVPDDATPPDATAPPDPIAPATQGQPATQNNLQVFPMQQQATVDYRDPRGSGVVTAYNTGNAYQYGLLGRRGSNQGGNNQGGQAQYQGGQGGQPQAPQNNRPRYADTNPPNRTPNALRYGVDRLGDNMNRALNRRVMTDADFEQYYGEPRRREREEKPQAEPQMSRREKLMKPYEGKSSDELIRMPNSPARNRAIRETVEREQRAKLGNIEDISGYKYNRGQKIADRSEQRYQRKYQDAMLNNTRDVGRAQRTASDGARRQSESQAEYEARLTKERSWNEDKLHRDQMQNDYEVARTQGFYDREAERYVIDQQQRTARMTNQMTKRGQDAEGMRLRNEAKMKKAQQRSMGKKVDVSEMDPLHENYQYEQPDRYWDGDYLGGKQMANDLVRNSNSRFNTNLNATKMRNYDKTFDTGKTNIRTGDIGTFDYGDDLETRIQKSLRTNIDTPDLGGGQGDNSNKDNLGGEMLYGYDYDPTKLKYYGNKMQHYANMIPTSYNTSKYLFDRPLVERSAYNKQDENFVQGMRNNLVQANMENINSQASTTLDNIRNNSRGTGTMMANLLAANTSTSNLKNQLSHQANTTNMQQRNSYLQSLHGVGANRNAEDKSVAARNIQNVIAHEKFGKDAREAMEKTMINKAELHNAELKDHITVTNYLNNLGAQYKVMQDQYGNPVVRFKRPGSNQVEQLMLGKGVMPDQGRLTHNAYASSHDMMIEEIEEKRAAGTMTDEDKEFEQILIARGRLKPYAPPAPKTVTPKGNATTPAAPTTTPNKRDGGRTYTFTKPVPKTRNYLFG